MDIVASDHSPSTPDVKLFDTGDFINSWGGFAGPFAWSPPESQPSLLHMLTRPMQRGPLTRAGNDTRRRLKAAPSLMHQAPALRRIQRSSILWLLALPTMACRVRAGLQYSLPAVWNGSVSRGVGPERLAQWLSERPAAIAGLQQRKGRLAVGLDADLLVRSFAVTRPLCAAHSRPFVGCVPLSPARPRTSAFQAVHDHHLPKQSSGGHDVHSMLCCLSCYSIGRFLTLHCDYALRQVWDPEALADTSSAACFHKHKTTTAFRDTRLMGRVKATFVRGHLVFEDAVLPAARVSKDMCGSMLLRGRL